MLYEVATTLKLLEQSITNSPKISPQDIYNPAHIWMTDRIYVNQFEKDPVETNDTIDCDDPSLETLLTVANIPNLKPGLTGCYFWNEVRQENGTLIFGLNKGYRLNVTAIKYNLLKDVQDKGNIAGFVEDMFPAADRLPPYFQGDKYTDGKENIMQYQIRNRKIVVRYGWNSYTEIDCDDFVKIVNGGIFSDEELKALKQEPKPRNGGVIGDESNYILDPITGEYQHIPTSDIDTEQSPIPIIAIVASVAIVCQLIFIAISSIGSKKKE